MVTEFGSFFKLENQAVGVSRVIFGAQADSAYGQWPALNMCPYLSRSAIAEERFIEDSRVTRARAAYLQNRTGHHPPTPQTPRTEKTYFGLAPSPRAHACGPSSF